MKICRMLKYVKNEEFAQYEIFIEICQKLKICEYSKYFNIMQKNYAKRNAKSMHTENLYKHTPFVLKEGRKCKIVMFSSVLTSCLQCHSGDFANMIVMQEGASSLVVVAAVVQE